MTIIHIYRTNIITVFARKGLWVNSVSCIGPYFDDQCNRFFILHDWMSFMCTESLLTTLPLFSGSPGLHAVVDLSFIACTTSSSSLPAEELWATCTI